MGSIFPCVMNNSLLLVVGCLSLMASVVIGDGHGVKHYLIQTEDEELVGSDDPLVGAGKISSGEGKTWSNEGKTWGDDKKWSSNKWSGEKKWEDKKHGRMGK